MNELLVKLSILTSQWFLIAEMCMIIDLMSLNKLLGVKVVESYDK